MIFSLILYPYTIMRSYLIYYFEKNYWLVRLRLNIVQQMIGIMSLID